MTADSKRALVETVSRHRYGSKARRVESASCLISFAEIVVTFGGGDGSCGGGDVNIGFFTRNETVDTRSW